MFGFVANPAPGEFEWWGQHMVTDETGHAALVLNMQTTLIRAEADRLLTSGPRTADKIAQALDLLHRARQIVLELGTWLQTCLTTWPKSVSGFADAIPLDDDAALERATALPGPIYTFPNVSFQFFSLHSCCSFNYSLLKTITYNQPPLKTLVVQL